VASTQNALRTRIELGTVDDVRRSHGLLVKHWQEVCTDTVLMELDPDWPAYYELEERGRTFTLMARCGTGPGDNEVVGYSLNFIGPHLHYKKLVVAQNDVLFVDTLNRARGTGPRLIRATERKARELGANIMAWHAKKEPPMLANLLPKMGYGVQDIFYTRSI